MTKDEIIEYLYENHVHADFKIEEMAEDLAEPVRMKGKWIEEKEDWRNQIVWVSCSECGFASGTSYNFCPNCGADMRGEEDDNSNLVNSNL